VLHTCVARLSSYYIENINAHFCYCSYLCCVIFDKTGTVSLCSVVIMEGNPHPGAIKGRMSFQNFNPSIDVSLERLFLLHLPFWQLCTCRFVFPYASLDV
jgi:hypothetical protein